MTMIRETEGIRKTPPDPGGREVSGSERCDGALARLNDILTTQVTVMNALALRLINLDVAVAKVVNTPKPQAAPPPAPWKGSLPRVSSTDILAEAPPIRLLDTAGIGAAGGNTSLEELALMMRLARMAEAESIFEFGTFDGRTTVNLAANCPAQGKVFTLDPASRELDATHLPLDPRNRAYTEKAACGAHYRDTTFESKIVQLYGDSSRFDFSAYYGSVDLVFLGAAHQYDHVLNDSAIALRLLRNGKGTVAWHKYTPRRDGVVRALDQLAKTEPKFAAIRHIENTALAYAVVR